MADEIVTNQQKSPAPYVGAGVILGTGAGLTALNVAKDKNPIRKWAEVPKYKTLDDIAKEYTQKDKLDLSSVSEDLKNQYKISDRKFEKVVNDDVKVASEMKSKVEEYTKNIAQIKETAKKEGKSAEEIKTLVEAEKAKLKNELAKIRKYRDVKFEMESKVEGFYTKRNEILETAKKEGKKPEEVKEVISKEQSTLKDDLKTLRKELETYKPETIKKEKCGISSALKPYEEMLKKKNLIFKNNIENYHKILESLKENSKKLHIGKTALVIGAPAFVLAMLGGLVAPKDK